jgi:ferrous iron transport protein B
LPLVGELPVLNAPSKAGSVVLVGNPNAGKTTLFNSLTGLRAKTANFPGITVDLRHAHLHLPDQVAELIDLPGLYSLDALSPEEKVAESVLRGELKSVTVPDVVLLVLDATNLERNLFLASEILDLNLPTVVALNMMDAADSAGMAIDVDGLARKLRCPVIPVSARKGTGLDLLRATLGDALSKRPPVVDEASQSCTVDCNGCSFAARFDWAGRVAGESVRTPDNYGRTSAALDKYLTKPFWGIAAFLTVMLGVFYLIFSLADVPMTLIESGFTRVAATVGRLFPTEVASPLLWSVVPFGLGLLLFSLGYRLNRIQWTWRSGFIAALVSAVASQMPIADFQSLLVDGIIGGVGGVVIFLPQICILFFFITLLEDSGYMARAAFVMERLMRSVGLPGKAFVPMLSAHACAIPGIMAARVIENWRDRLVTILVLPLLTCSARLPVYSMVAALLFGESPGKAALVFIGAYLLGIVAALLTAWVLKKSILPGEAEPLVLELPPYRIPSVRNALMTVFDRATVFLQNAGTVILLISVVLWGLAKYPKLTEDQLPTMIAARVTQLQAEAASAGDETAGELAAQAEQLIASEELAYSFAGRMGRFVEPIFRPLGFDWKINIGVLSSFAAREVIVSTLAIVYGIGEDAAEDTDTLVATLRSQKRPDGTPVFTTATCLSLLVFYVLAMQCLPTQVVTKRETGSWKWALLQLGYMTVLAYTASFVVYQVARAAGLG